MHVGVTENGGMTYSRQLMLPLYHTSTHGAGSHSKDTLSAVGGLCMLSFFTLQHIGKLPLPLSDSCIMQQFMHCDSIRPPPL